MSAAVTSTAGEAVGEGKPAGIVSRGLAAVVDAVAIFALDIGIYAALAAVRFMTEPERFTAPDPGVPALLGSAVALAVVYFTIGWAVSGRTYGAAVFGIRLVDSSGRIPGWGRALLRAVLCVAFPVGVLWAAVSTQRRSVQDLLLRTRVVYDWHRT